MHPKQGFFFRASKIFSKAPRVKVHGLTMEDHQCLFIICFDLALFPSVCDASMGLISFHCKFCYGRVFYGKFNGCQTHRDLNTRLPYILSEKSLKYEDCYVWSKMANLNVKCVVCPADGGELLLLLLSLRRVLRAG